MTRLLGGVAKSKQVGNPRRVRKVTPEGKETGCKTYLIVTNCTYLALCRHKGRVIGYNGLNGMRVG